MLFFQQEKKTFREVALIGLKNWIQRGGLSGCTMLAKYQLVTKVCTSVVGKVFN